MPCRSTVAITVTIVLTIDSNISSIIVILILISILPVDLIILLVIIRVIHWALIELVLPPIIVIRILVLIITTVILILLIIVARRMIDLSASVGPCMLVTLRKSSLLNLKPLHPFSPFFIKAILNSTLLPLGSFISILPVVMTTHTVIVILFH